MISGPGVDGRRRLSQMRRGSRVTELRPCWLNNKNLSNQTRVQGAEGSPLRLRMGPPRIRVLPGGAYDLSERGGQYPAAARRSPCGTAASVTAGSAPGGLQEPNRDPGSSFAETAVLPALRISSAGEGAREAIAASEVRFMTGGSVQLPQDLTNPGTRGSQPKIKDMS